jgi:hypothetical protein
VSLKGAHGFVRPGDERARWSARRRRHKTAALSLVFCVQSLLAGFAAVPIAAAAQNATRAEDTPSWTIVLRPADFAIGAALDQLHTRRKWAAGFDEQRGGFEVALRKKAVAIPAPKCRMDYLILTIPFYYPETPKQASLKERRAVYDAFVALQSRGSGRLTVHVEAPLGLAQRNAGRIQLAACNLFFAFPLSVQSSAP